MFAAAKVVQIERKTKFILLKIIKRQQIFHFSLFTFHLNFVTLQPE